MSKEHQSKNKIIRLIIVVFSIAIIVLLFLIFSKLNSSTSSENLDTSSTNNSSSDNSAPVNNVSIEDGKQIITIDVRDGYSPKVSTAKADMPTVLRFKTNGSFGCASSIYLPSMNYRTNLPLSGNTDIPLPTQKAGVFRGMCSMGMYNFIINFQ
jgi:plastocyanin domain-containing protein